MATKRVQLYHTSTTGEVALTQFTANGIAQRVYMSEEEALKLAHRLMSFASGGGGTIETVLEAS